MSEGSLGGFASPVVSNSGGVVLKPGYVGQITLVTNLTLVAAPAALLPGQSSQLSGWAWYDDGTVAAVDGSEIAWDPPVHPIASISTNGVATAAPVSSYKVGTVTGYYFGVAGSTTIEVLAPPTVTTLAATEVVLGPGGLQARLNGSVNPGGRPAAAWFEWGLSTNYGQVTPVTPVGSGTASVAVSFDLPPLGANAIYHYRVVATNTVASAVGADESFGFSSATVTTLADAGPGSLRQAILDAVPGSEITFAVAGTIALTSGELLVTKNLTITGPGAAQLTIDGGGAKRLFHVPAQYFGTPQLHLSGLTLTHGRAPVGGAILSEGGLELDQCVLAENQATAGDGGAISSGGALVLRRTTLRANVAKGGNGGAVRSRSLQLDVAECTFADNECDLSGGAIAALVEVPPAVVALAGLGRVSTYSGVRFGDVATTLAVVAEGETIGFTAGYATQLLEGGGGCPSCLTQHYLGINGVWADCHDLHTSGGTTGKITGAITAPLQAGVYYLTQTPTWWYYCSQFGTPGFDNDPASAVAALLVRTPGAGVPMMPIVNATFTGNRAGGTGGALAGDGWGAFALEQSTLWRNQAGAGGGVGILANASETQLHASIVSGNLSSEPGLDIFGPLVSAGFNLLGSTNGMQGVVASTDLVGPDPRLGPLQDNGGPTPTLALFADSPALDQLDEPEFPATDQRGLPRASSGGTFPRADIGAFEAQYPVIGSVADQAGLEDQSVGPIVVALSDADSPVAALKVTARSSNPALLDDAGILVGGFGPTRSVILNPRRDAVGSALITLEAVDPLGFKSQRSFTYLVDAVNDAPAFVKGPDVRVLEDSGAYQQPWASGISAGPADEASSQSVAFVVEADHPELFSVQPGITPTGVLSFTPAAQANGSSVVRVMLRDTGGTANGGVDTSALATFVIRVDAVNDAPTFVRGPDVRVLEDSGSYQQPWASGISAGPADEASSQSVAFVVEANHPELFTVQPGLTPAGVLSFTAAAQANGSSVVRVMLRDTGGTANGGVDTSAVATFVIRVDAVNDAPSFVLATNRIVVTNQLQGVDLAFHFPQIATELRAGPPDEAGQQLGFVTLVNNNPELFVSGHAPRLAANGDLEFMVVSNQFGPAKVTFQLRDDGGTASGGIDASAPAELTIEVRSPPVIDVAPADQTWPVGTTVELVVAARGNPAPTYQWSFENLPLEGATNATLTLPYVQSAKAGRYAVEVRNALGRWTGSATVTVVPVKIPLGIAEQPEDAWVSPGGILRLSVLAQPGDAAPESLVFQWRRNGSVLDASALAASTLFPAHGAGSITLSREGDLYRSTLEITDFQPADAGAYSVSVASGATAIESRQALVRPVVDSLPGSDAFAGVPAALAGIEGVGIFDSTGFTEEACELNDPDRLGGASAWFVWQSRTNGVALFSTAGSSFDTVLAVYTEDCEPVSLVMRDDDSGGSFTSLVGFNVKANQPYHIAVRDHTGPGGVVVLGWQLLEGVQIPFITVQPASVVVTNTADPVTFSVTVSVPPIPGYVMHYQWQRNGTNLIDGGEGGHWTGVNTNTLRIDPGFQRLDRFDVGIYTVRLQNINERLPAIVSAPAILEIATGNVITRLPSQDKFEDIRRSVTNYYFELNGPRGVSAPGLGGRAGVGLMGGLSFTAGTVISDNFRARSERHETNVANVLGGASRWYYLPVTRTGLYSVQTTGSAFDSLLAVYCATNLAQASLARGLTFVAGDDNSSPDGVNAYVRFIARSDRHYFIQVDGRNGAHGTIQLDWRGAPGPEGDNFKWLVYQATEAGTLVLTTTNSNIRKVYFAFTGTDYDNMTEVLFLPENGVGDQVQMPVVADRTYLVLVDAVDGHPGHIVPHWSFHPNESLSIGGEGRRVRLSWPGPGWRLQAAGSPLGPWFDWGRTEATNAAILTLPEVGARGAQFFRLTPP